MTNVTHTLTITHDNNTVPVTISFDPKDLFGFKYNTHEIWKALIAVGIPNSDSITTYIEELINELKVVSPEYADYCTYYQLYKESTLHAVENADDLSQSLEVTIKPEFNRERFVAIVEEMRQIGRKYVGETAYPVYLRKLERILRQFDETKK